MWQSHSLGRYVEHFWIGAIRQSGPAFTSQINSIYSCIPRNFSCSNAVCIY